MSRTTRQLWLAVIAAALAALSSSTLASNGEKAYSEGPIKASDFQGKVPKPLPVVDGITLKSETATSLGIDVPDYVSSGTPNPDETLKVTTSSKAPAVAATLDRMQSWIDPGSSGDAGLIDHEQGHFDLAEKEARLLQATYNAMEAQGQLTVTQTLPKGATQEDFDKAVAENRKSIAQRIDKAYHEAVAANQRDGIAYDKATAHGTKADEQKKAREAQRKALTDPNRRDERKKGPDGKSASAASLAFDGATGLLTVTGDLIVGIDPRSSGFVIDPADPVLGAELRLPAFVLAGRLLDGSFFFSWAPGAGATALVVGTQPLFGVLIDYLLYAPDDNLLFGLGTSFEASSDSAFVRRLVLELTAGEPALFGIEISPDSRLDLATADFTASASMAMTNSLGARDIPEPGTAGLIVLGWVGLWLARRRR